MAIFDGIKITKKREKEYVSEVYNQFTNFNPNKTSVSYDFPKPQANKSLLHANGRVNVVKIVILQ